MDITEGSWVSSMGAFFSMSFILATTSLIIQSGVEAPAVIPMTSDGAARTPDSSAADSMKNVLGQNRAASRYSLRLLELSRPPMTIITSAFRAISTHSFCRSRVAGQMVARTSGRSIFPASAEQSSQNFSSTMVVWLTTSALDRWGSLSTSSRLSTAYFSPSVQPRMPRTSGCSASPTTTRGIPARLASRAMS